MSLSHNLYKRVGYGYGVPEAPNMDWTRGDLDTVAQKVAVNAPLSREERLAALYNPSVCQFRGHRLQRDGAEWLQEGAGLPSRFGQPEPHGAGAAPFPGPGAGTYVAPLEGHFAGAGRWPTHEPRALEVEQPGHLIRTAPDYEAERRFHAISRGDAPAGLPGAYAPGYGPRAADGHIGTEHHHDHHHHHHHSPHHAHANSGHHSHGHWPLVSSSHHHDRPTAGSHRH